MSLVSSLNAASAPDAGEPTVVRTMHIGELADRAEMSLRTIRHYDEVDLLRPSGRTEGGFRLYTERDLERLLVIRRMKPLGFSLTEMRDLLDITDQLESGADESVRVHLLERLQGFIENTAERRAKLERNLGWADEFSALLQNVARVAAGSQTHTTP